MHAGCQSPNGDQLVPFVVADFVGLVGAPAVEALLARPARAGAPDKQHARTHQLPSLSLFNSVPDTRSSSFSPLFFSLHHRLRIRLITVAIITVNRLYGHHTNTPIVTRHSSPACTLFAFKFANLSTRPTNPSLSSFDHTNRTPDEGRDCRRPFSRTQAAFECPSRSGAQGFCVSCSGDAG